MPEREKEIQKKDIKEFVDKLEQGLRQPMELGEGKIASISDSWKGGEIYEKGVKVRG